MSESKNVTVQFPILGLLGLIFITLKLTGYIAWSWLWVLSPFWIPLAIAAVIFLVVFIVAVFTSR
jgi:hypothetical protein